MKLRSAVLTLLCLGWGTVATGQGVTRVGTSAAAFLRIPAGTKGTAMGGAFTALADDGSAAFWNPGAAGRQDKNGLFIHHSDWLPGLEYDFVALTLPLRQYGVVGIDIVSLRSGEMEVTTLDAPMGTGETYTSSSTAVGLLYARSLTDRFSIGVNLKYVNEQIFHSSAGGFAFDIGTLFITPFKGIRLGVNVANVGTRLRMQGEDLNSYVDIAPNQQGNNDEIVAALKTDYFILPIILRLGLAWDWILSPGSRLTLACEGVNPNDDAQSVNLGIEYAVLNNMLMLRGGYSELLLKESSKGWTFGAGLDVAAFAGVKMRIGYAWQDFKYLGAVNHFSVDLTF
ncbi:MAG TPA: PorV/PorQ family protein [bacterium]|nr:PorV/PorQ family protein [bacterium]HPR88718.1 PorV/PorQ family protein [bacterium]